MDPLGQLVKDYFWDPLRDHKLLFLEMNTDTQFKISQKQQKMLKKDKNS